MGISRCESGAKRKKKFAMTQTLGERQYLESIRQRLDALKRHLNEESIPDLGAPITDWYRYLLAMKEISGNASNGMSFVAGLMAKDYLARKLHMRPFDIAAKAQGAPGLDIDEQTLDGQRVIGEIKTTIPYMGNDLGAQQRTTFMKDFEKLRNAAADYKFFFLTDPKAFRLMAGKYAAQIPSVTVVLLTTGEEHTVPSI